MFVRQVVAFGKILFQVVKLPLVIFKVRIGLMIGDRFPALVPEAAVSGHFKILRFLSTGGIGVFRPEGIGQTGTVNRYLGYALVDAGRL